MSSVKWLPLESNPETINAFLSKIGVSGAECTDVYGFEDELLEFLPKPQYALILCFPDYKKVDELMRPVYEKLEKEGAKIPENVFFAKQKISNACGTFALFHSLANNSDKIDLGSGSFRKWLDEALKVDVEARSDTLAANEDLAKAHESCAQQGDTNVSLEDKVEHHFICYVNHDGKLLEIDSRMPCPRECGSTSQETLIKDAGKVCRELMDKMDNTSFAAMALVGK
uniref:Ubiquitin carboxyl-terminal hydrolase n=1 Tax=Steinernema glaseri TaxID=37863 RepID=A0A1I8A297_9BILA